VAVAAERGVGVDVERIRPLTDLSSIQERFFSREEQEFLAAAGEAEGAGAPPRLERTRAFLALWTRREAAAKAMGLDLQAALAQVQVPVYPPGGTAVLAGLPEPGTAAAAADNAGPWSLHDLPLDPEHVGAVCVQGERPAVLLRNFLPSQFL
jgi:4'-phosphopantetheinyl transferase